MHNNIIQHQPLLSTENINGNGGGKDDLSGKQCFCQLL